MPKMKSLVAAGLVAFTMTLGAIGGASADPSGLGVNPNASTENNANCVARASRIWTHNGQAESLGQGGDPSHGVRGAEIKAFQASC